MKELFEDSNALLILAMSSPMLGIVAYVRYKLWRMEREQEREELARQEAEKLRETMLPQSLA